MFCLTFDDVDRLSETDDTLLRACAVAQMSAANKPPFSVSGEAVRATGSALPDADEVAVSADEQALFFCAQAQASLLQFVPKLADVPPDTPVESPASSCPTTPTHGPA